MKTETAKQKEQRLNETFSDCMMAQDALIYFEYMTSKQRKAGQRTTKSNILNCYYSRRLGSLLRRLDPIAFNCA